MASQVSTGNERSRTYWTPTMERYFVDLMLEHLQKGNRSGHTFSKYAWNDMLAVFNTNFGSQYDKDVLKSRYTNLWKQFNDVKSLLGYGGFSWDEARNMVVADDYVWDAYIKAHPDARSYKTKSVQNFSDLCLIYGYTTADGRYSRSSHDVDIDDELHGVSVGDGLGSPTSSNIDRSKTEWNKAMDQFFIELLLGQVEKGHKLNNNAPDTKEAWTEMLNSFNGKFGHHHSKRILKHRYKKLLKYYTDMIVLLKQDGFSWGAEEQMVVAKDDVWDAYIKGHPQARSYRAKSVPNYKDLESIFGGGIATTRSQSNKLGEGTRAKTGSDRSRTHWTGPMDCYLIDLLLDQVNRGNGSGHTFVAQAWNDMLKSFNTNFNSNHDKDVLKNRYKHLKKQYNEINTLLGEKGFSWDNAREMVTAKDHVWDAYIKAHPDARSYRVKTVPNFHKLCVVYGQGSEGRYSHLARTVGVPGKCNTSELSSEAKEDWTSEMDESFIELMLEQHKGNKIFHGYDDKIWTAITTSFNERCKLQYEYRDLQERYAYFMKQFNEVKCLINQNGFSWDDALQMVVADVEAWEAINKEHPFATSYMGIVLRHHKDFSIIFGGFGSENLIVKSETPVDMETDAIGGNPQIVPKKTTTANKKRRAKKTPLALGRSGKVQRNQSEDIKVAFSDMANVVTKLVNGKTNKNDGAIEKAVDALQSIPDIDDELLLDGCDILEDERKAKTFLALDASLRKKWLLRKLGR